MKSRGKPGLKNGSEPGRLRVCVAAFLAAAALSACSSSEPPSLPNLAGPAPPAESASSTMPAPKSSGVPAVSASQPTPATSPAPTQIAGFRASTVILYSSDAGTDGQKVPVSTLSLPLPIAAISHSKKRLAIHTVEGIRWIAITDVVLPGHAPSSPVSTAKTDKAKRAAKE